MLLNSAIIALAQQCAPNVAAHTMGTLVASESSGNQYAIGVVDARLEKQPTSLEEAVATARALIKQGANISLGLTQVNVKNLEPLGLTIESAFEPCPNIRAGAQILSNCYQRASTQIGEGQEALKAALSCYYSNNFQRGFVTESGDKPSYVMRIAQNSEQLKVPSIDFKPNEVQEVKPTTQPIKAVTEKTEKITALEKLSDDRDTKDGTTVGKSPRSWDVLNDFN